MNVIVPQYIYAPDLSESERHATLAASNIDADPTTDIYDPTSAYTTDDPVYFLETSGSSKGCWSQYKALADIGASREDPPDPPDDPTNWSFQGAINRYRMFDQYVGTFTENDSGNIVVAIHCQAIDSIAFLNSQTENIDIEVYGDVTLAQANAMTSVNDTGSFTLIDSKTIVNDELIYDWREYYFKEFEYLRNISDSFEVGLYNDILLKITFNKIDSLPCKVGTVLVGNKYYIGQLQYDVSTGIEDYSKKVFDETFGAHTFIEGEFRRTMDCDLIIENDNVMLVDTILTQLRARPTLWDGNDDTTSYNTFVVYGIPQDFTLIMKYYTHSLCSLEIQGLT